MVKSTLKTILFLCFLITFINSQVAVEYNHGDNHGESQQSNASQQKSFVLNFDPNKSVPYYIKVTVTPKEDEPTPVLCFSNKDQYCLGNRQAISKRTDGKPGFLFVKKEQITGTDEKLYILVTCVNSGCSYTLSFDGDQAAVIDSNQVYSYLVSSANREMTFEVKGTAEEGSFLNVGFEGSSSATLNIDGAEANEYDFGNGKIVNIALDTQENASILGKFSIRNAVVGEYITLSVHVVTDSIAEDNFLYPNGPAVMGSLERTDGYFVEECFPVSAFTSEEYKSINKYYLTGTIYSKYALFWLADENGMYMEETEQEIHDGKLSYFIQTNGKARSVCFEFSYEDAIKTQNVAYSIQIMEPTTLEDVYNFYPPQIIGEFYRRMLPKGKIAVFQGAKIESSAKRYSYNLYNRKGIAEMYITTCNNYPDCRYEVDTLASLDKVKNTNKMSVWDTTVEKSGAYEALDSKKPVMIVHCLDGDNEDKGYCEFDTSIFTQGQTITLLEDEKLSKFVLKGETGTFKIDLKGGIQIQRITVDIMVFSGDVSFNVKESADSLKAGKLGEDIDLNYFKYYLANKVFFHFNFAQLQLYDLEIEFKADLNSFFTIQYGMHSYNLNQLQEVVPSGENYLVQIDPNTNDKTKTIFLSNYRYKSEQPFVANFFALNCDFAVFRGETEIPFFDGYAQETLDKNSKGYKSESYEYKIYVVEPDLSNYNHKMCMLYVSGYETKDSIASSEVVIAENVNQQIIFDDTFKQVRFLYPQADSTKDLALHVNVIDRAVYTVKMFLNTKSTPLKDFTVTRTQTFYIDADDLYLDCNKDSLCNIIFEVEYANAIEKVAKTNPMVEITVRQILNTPSYLQKGQAKTDFTCGDHFYYLYTDIGKNEAGEVSVNFLRDFGEVWGKVVRKDKKDPEQEANWRGIYRMPSKDWDDGLPYNGYIKKFSVGVEQTQDCIEGCYLLLSIRISQIGEYVDDSKFYPFSIITKITPNNHAYTDIPKVVIQVDELVIGNVDKADNERIYEFYQVWFPHDSFSVEFDWQSEVAGLYINVGDARPTTKNADIKLLPKGRDGILSIDKAQILEAAKKRKIKLPYENSIQDLSIVIGVWTDKLDSVDTEVYSLKVHQPNDQLELDIIEANTDQKTLCTPTFVSENFYRCLFMITYDNEDVDLEMPILLYGKSLNHSAITNTYASFVERELYDTFELEELRKVIPTSETAKYNTAKDNTEFIYTVLDPEASKDNDYYLFVSVTTDIEGDIMLLTSMPMYNKITEKKFEFYPNPSTEQLLAVQTDQLRLRFFTSSSMIVNFVTLGGEADLMWANDDQNVFNLRGRGDRLSLTSGEKVNEIVITKKESAESLVNDPGFVFYVSYFLRSLETNFDHVEYGKSIEIGYRETDLPVYLYSKIGTFNNDINIAFTFKDSDIDTEGEYDHTPFIVRGALTKESSVYKTKLYPDLAPALERSMYGSYDMALKTAQVFLSGDFVQSLGLKESDNPTLYLSVEKNSLVPSQKYKKFNVEVQFNKVNDGVIPVEKTFNYGRHGGYYSNYYRLKVDKKKKIMKIEIAFNSKYLNFSIDDHVSRTNYTAIIKEAFVARGKVYLTVHPPTNRDFIFLNIFQNNRRDEYSMYLDNYVFKYLNIENEDDYVDYKILNDDGELEIKEETDETNNHTITCTFNKINIEKNKANITYFFKVVDNETHYYEEKFETIAVMESPFVVVYKRNPEDSNGRITLKARGNLANWVYLQVIAQIQQDTILEYVSYKGKYILRPPKEGSGTNSSGGMTTQTFLIVGGILLLLIIGLVVVVFIFQQRNKSLLNQVKHVSFQQNAQNSGSADPNLLLQKNQQ